MCGIAGFIGAWPDTLIDRMVADLRHRGPDSTGVFRDRDASVALGHTRLSILDLSTAAEQPMISPDGRYALIYNGELYNYPALRAELEAAGVVFRTRSDTEAFLHCLIREGLSALDRFIGIFAAALWDRQERRLWLMRDQLGVKPLYYANLSTGLLFASELKVLARCPGLPRDLNPEAVASHLSYLWTADDATMIHAVRKLRPGHVLIHDHRGVQVRRYYRTPLPSQNAECRSPDEMRALLDQVVADQMLADVPVGAMLSGGLDSSAIVASMCRVRDPSEITTFCARVESGGGSDNVGADVVYARSVASHLGVPLVEIETGAELIDSLSDMLWALDEPTGDFAALQLRLICREARRQDMRVLLTGIGGDDIFAGYPAHRLAWIFDRSRSLGALRQLIATLAAFAPAGSRTGRRIRKLTLLGEEEDRLQKDLFSLSSLSSEQRAALLVPEIRQAASGGTEAALTALLEQSRGQDAVTRQLDLDLNAFLPDHNLNYADKMGMAESVELRVPLLDLRMVAFAMGLPSANKISLFQTKLILRESQRSRLPKAVLKRPKQGFGVPLRAWLNGPAHDALEDLTAPAVLARRGLFSAPAVAELKSDLSYGRNDVAFPLFSVMCMESWCRRLDEATVYAP